MNWLLNRLKEKSTWLAIFTLVGLFGMNIEPELRDHIIDAILAIAAAVAFVFREEGYKKEQELYQIELIAKPESAVQLRDHLPIDRTDADIANGLSNLPPKPDASQRPDASDIAGWGG